MGNAAALLKLILALLSSLGLSGAGSPEPQAASNDGVISAVNAWSLTSLPPAQIDRQFAAMSRAGVDTVRLDASWANIEPRAPAGSSRRASYDFAAYDGAVGAMAVHHLRWEPILDYSAPWAASRPGDWRSPPADDAVFAAFAKAVAARYGAGGSYWRAHRNLPYEPAELFEVWNEENGSYFWDTGPNPAAYARLYLTTRAAIRSVDPAAQVIVGGLVTGASEFVAAMFHAYPSLHGNVDGFGLHPYYDSGAAVDVAVESFRRSLIGLGEGEVPIDITEFGWLTGSTTPEGWRAQMMRQVASTLGRSNCGVRLLAPYDWMNPGAGPDGDWGIADAGGLRASGIAWFSALASAATKAPLALCAA